VQRDRTSVPDGLQANSEEGRDGEVDLRCLLL